MITLTSIVYEGNYVSLLNDDSWFFKIDSNLISNKLLAVNNISSTEDFNNRIKDLQTRYLFKVVYVNEQQEMVKKLYNLNVDETTLGYVYTIPYFILIDNVTTKFILNVASDCMKDIKIDDVFLNDSKYELTNNPLCSTTMVAWTKDNYIMVDGKKVGETDSIGTFNKLNRSFNESEKFNYTFNFTDQFFMGITDNLKKINFNIPENISSKIYQGPSYGGNSFEKRMVGHQIQNNKYNCIYKGPQYYIHDNNYY